MIACEGLFKTLVSGTQTFHNHSMILFHGFRCLSFSAAQAGRNNRDHINIKQTHESPLYVGMQISTRAVPYGRKYHNSAFVFFH